MKEMSLSDIQQVSLDILKDVHNFCESNNIRYSLAYGTLIGAIRHKGFIPWDDDVDIMMPRPDYERFCRTYNGQYRLFCHENDKNCLIGFARVCDMERTFVRQATWNIDHTGVWIDVFPIDGVEDSYDQYETRYFKALQIVQSLQIHRAANKRISSCYPLRTNIKTMLLRTLFLGGLIGRKRTDKLIRLAKEIPFGSSRKCSQLVEGGTKEHLDSESFENYIKVPFETSELYIIADYDRVLRIEYGDYLSLPPESERIPKQDYLRFFWK